MGATELVEEVVVQSNQEKTELVERVEIELAEAIEKSQLVEMGRTALEVQEEIRPVVAEPEKTELVVAAAPNIQVGRTGLAAEGVGQSKEVERMEPVEEERE